MNHRSVPAKPTAIATILVCVLALAHSTTGRAQTPAPPPVFPAVDSNGVDVATGTFNFAQTDVVIGPPNGGLAYTRYHLSGPNSSWTHNHNSYIAASGTTCTVVLGPYTETFTSSQSGCTGGITSNQQLGSLLVYNSTYTSWTLTRRDGSVATFDNVLANYTMYDMPSSAVGYLISIASPEGETASYGYSFSTYTVCYPDPQNCWYQYTYGYGRLALVLEAAYALVFEYPGPPDSLVPPNKVTGINRAVEYCSGWNCSLPWPSATYAYNANKYPTRVKSLLCCKSDDGMRW